MSRRPSERKAKTAASHFLKRLTGADDSAVSLSVSNKRKLMKVADNEQPVAKKGKISVKEVQQATNLQSRSAKPEPNTRVEKRLKTDNQLKTFESSTGTIATRGYSSQNETKNKNKSGILPSSTTQPPIKKESRNLEAVMNEELVSDFVKTESVVDNSEPIDEKDKDNKLNKPFMATENVQYGDDDVKHVPLAKKNHELSIPSGSAALSSSFEVMEPHADAVTSFASATLSDQLHYSSLESNFEPKDARLKIAEGIEHVLYNDHSRDSGVNTLSCSSPACHSTLTPLDGSQKTDASETQSEHSAFGDVWECRDLVSDAVLSETGESSISSIGTHLPEVLQRESVEITCNTSIDYPTISIGNFLAFSGLINKAELPSPSAALANRLHREAGGKLRRCIKTYREPQMVYRRVNSGSVDSVAKLNSGETSVLSSERESPKVNELKRIQGSKSRFSQFLVKNDLSAGPVKTDVKNSFAEVSAVSSTGVDVALRKVDYNKTSSASSHSPVAKNDFKKPKPVTKVDQSQEDLMPSRRSARQSGTQRKEWRHLLRANPDEHEAKSQETGSDIARGINQKAKPAPSDASPVKRTMTSTNRTNGETGASVKNGKNENPPARQSDAKPAFKAPLTKSKSLPSSSVSKKTVVIHENRSCSPVDLSDTKDDIPERIGNWDILKYRYKEMECVTPHMCTVCWVNDHMYCKNMKRTSSDLPHFLPCIHYIACSHFRTFNQLYDGSVFRSLGHDTRGHQVCSKSYRWNTNELISLDDESRPPNKILSEDDLLCNEVMLESDAESSNHSAEGTELLQIQLKARTAQIFQSLGVDELPHGKSPPLDVCVEKAADLAEDSDGGTVDVFECAAEVLVYDRDGSMEADGLNVCLIEDQNDLCIVQGKTASDDSCELSGVEIVEEEPLNRPGMVKRLKSPTFSNNGRGSQKGKDCEISNQRPVKSLKCDKVKGKTVVSAGSKSKQALRNSFEAAEMKKCTKNKDKSMHSNAVRNNLEERREKLARLLETTDSDLSDFQVAIEQQKRRHSTLTVDVSKMTEQLTLKRAQVLAYDKEKQDLKRRFDCLQSQLSDIKQSASRHQYFVGLFDKFLPWSQVSAGNNNPKMSTSLSTHPSIGLQARPTTNELRHIKPDFAGRLLTESDASSRPKIQRINYSEGVNSLSISAINSMPGVLGTTAKRYSIPETSLRTVVATQSDYKVPSSSSSSSYAADGPNTVTIFLPQPIISRSMISVAPSVRLVVSTGWQLPKTCGTQMRTTRPMSIADDMSAPARGVVLNTPRLVRHFSLPAKHQLQSLAVVPAQSVKPHSRTHCTSQPLQVSSLNKFVPVIRTTNSATSIAENHVELISDDDSEPELCFYGFENRSLGQPAQVPSLPDLLTPDPSCSSQESKASMDC